MDKALGTADPHPGTFAYVQHDGHCLLAGGRNSEMKPTPHLVFRLLDQFEKAKIFYTLRRVREDTIMIEAHVPGRRYEIEVFPDETVEVEVFKSEGEIGGKELVEELLAKYSEPQPTLTRPST
jgi:hypothetical protein